MFMKLKWNVKIWWHKKSSKPQVNNKKINKEQSFLGYGDQ